MIFTCLDFHPQTNRRVPPAKERAYRLRTNHIVDSFSLRIPKKIKTRLFHKLNVIARPQPSASPTFWELEGIACVELVVPDIATIYRASQAQAVKRVKNLLGLGIRIAARHDSLFAKHLSLWKTLLATTGDAFDHEFGISRSHPSRRWRCDAVLRIAPDHYHYDVLVRDSKTLQVIERHRVKTTACAFPFFSGIGFAKLRWHGQDIVGVTKDNKEAFRFKANLPIQFHRSSRRADSVPFSHPTSVSHDVRSPRSPTAPALPHAATGARC